MDYWIKRYVKVEKRDEALGKRQLAIVEFVGETCFSRGSGWNLKVIGNVI